MATSRPLYHDSVVKLSKEFLTVNGAGRFIPLARTWRLADISEFALIPREQYRYEQLPRWGRTEDNVWFTRDPRRWRRHFAVVISTPQGKIGFSPTHAERFADLLHAAGITRR
jgi:hypothetical protein